MIAVAAEARGSRRLSLLESRFRHGGGTVDAEAVVPMLGSRPVRLVGFSLVMTGDVAAALASFRDQ